LAPYGAFHLEGEEFERAYRARLEKAGVDDLRRQLNAISARHAGRDLVLLCFEDVWRDGEDACHRRSFARWWRDQTGELVEELPPAPALPDDPQVTPVRNPSPQKGSQEVVQPLIPMSPQTEASGEAVRQRGDRAAKNQGTSPSPGSSSEPPAGRRLVPTATPGIYKRGGRYVVRYRDPQGKQRQRSARTLAEARALKAALTADVARGEHRELSRISFDEYVAEWARTYTGRTGSGVRPETLREYRRDLELFAVPRFGRRRLSEIDPRDVKGFALHLAEDKGLSPASVRNVIAPLRALLATAVEEGLIRSNPAAGLRLPSRRSAPGEDAPEEQTKALTTTELKRLIAETPEGWQRLFVQFVAATGLRISEAIALRWRHIDFDRGRVLVRERLYEGRLDAPKSRFGRRDVPISAGMATRLRSHRLASRHSVDDDYVFCTLRGTAHRPENLLRRVLKPAARRADVPWVAWHALRHTCASNLFTGGANAKQVQVWLGHHSPAFTLATYVHLMPDDLPDAALLDSGLGLPQDVAQ